MGTVTRYPHGTFCWIDLGTTDPARAKAFYSGLFGWEIGDSSGPDDAGFSMCRLNGKDVAAIHRHGSGDGPGWTSYIAVDDVDATTAKAGQLGATVGAEPFDLPGVARMSEIVDVAGATVAFYQTQRHIGAAVVNEPGTWTWTELVTPDLDAAAAFYRELFGWSASEFAPNRLSFHLGDLLIAGAHSPSRGEHPDPRWDVSFRVDDVATSLERVQELGGSIIFGPMDIPIGRFAIMADPNGVASTVAEFETVVGSVTGS